MCVILHERPDITRGGGLVQKEVEAGDEVLMVLSIFEERGAFNTPDDDMVDGARCIDAALSGHAA